MGGAIATYVVVQTQVVVGVADGVCLHVAQ